MKTEHTPGPWKVRNERDVTLSYLDGRHQKDGIEIDILTDPDNSHIVTIKKADIVRGQALANARLIASAPDLLRVLELAKIDLLALGMDAGHNHMIKIDAAIEKAKGKSQ